MSVSPCSNYSETESLAQDSPLLKHPSDATLLDPDPDTQPKPFPCPFTSFKKSLPLFLFLLICSLSLFRPFLLFTVIFTFPLLYHFQVLHVKSVTVFIFCKHELFVFCAVISHCRRFNISCQ